MHRPGEICHSDRTRRNSRFALQNLFAMGLLSLTTILPLVGCSETPPPQPSPGSQQQAVQEQPAAAPKSATGGPASAMETPIVAPRTAPPKPRNEVELGQVLLAEALAAVPAPAAQVPDSEIEAEIERLLRESPARPLPSESRTTTNAGLRSRELAWLLALHTENYRRRGPSSPAWDREAMNFIDSVVATRAVGELVPVGELSALPEGDSANRLAFLFQPLAEVGAHERRNTGRLALAPVHAKELIPAGDNLLREGCSNPLVLHCYAYVLSRVPSHPNAGKLAELANRAVAGYTEFDYPQWLALDAELLLAELKELNRGERARRLVHPIAVFARGLATPPTDVIERRFLYRLLAPQVGRLKDAYFGKTLRSFLDAILNQPDADPWLVKMLAADAHTLIASQLRGNTYESQTSRDRTIGAEGHLRRARVLLLEAWRLQPENPESAIRLINLTRQLGGFAGETPRFWFDRAVAAQFDNPDAYQALRSTMSAMADTDFSIGSVEDVALLVEFSRECLASGRFDTSVPVEFQAGMERLSKAMGGYEKLLTRTGIPEDFRKLIAGYRAQVDQETHRARADSWSAALAWLAGDRAAAITAANRLGDDVDLRLWDDLGVAGWAIRMWGSVGADKPKITAVQIVGDGQILLTGELDGSLLFSAVADGRKLAVLKVGDTKVSSIAVSPDGLWFAAGTVGGQIAVGSVSQQQIRKTLDFDKVAQIVSFSPDGKLLAVAGPGTRGERGVALWDVATWQRSKSAVPELDPVQSFCFSPDGRVLAAGSRSGELVLWDLAEARPLREITLFEDALQAMAFSGDGRFLAVAGQDQMIMFPDVPERTYSQPLQRIHVLDAQTATIIRTLEDHWADVNALAFLRDHKTLIGGSADRTLRLWDIPSGRETARLIGQRGPVTGFALAPDQHWLMAVDATGTVQRWNLPGDAHRFFQRASLLDFMFWDMNGIAVHPDSGDVIAADGYAGAFVWRAAARFLEGTNFSESELFRRVGQLALSPDGTTIAASVTSYRQHEMRGQPWLGTRSDPAGQIRLHDAATGELQLALSVVDSPIHSLRFMNDGRCLATGMASGRVLFWDLARRQPCEWGAVILDGNTRRERQVTVRGEHVEFRPEVTAVAFTSTDDVCAAGDAEGSIELWTIPQVQFTGRRSLTSRGILRKLGGRISSLHFNAAGKQLLAGVESTSDGAFTTLINLEMLTVLTTIPRRFLALSPDAKTIAVAGPNSIQVLEFDTGKRLYTIAVRPGEEPAAATFTPNGEYLLAGGGKDQRVHAWRVTTGEAVRDLETAIVLSSLKSVPRTPSSIPKSPSKLLAAPPIYLLHEADQHESRYAALRILKAGGSVRIDAAKQIESVSAANRLRFGPFALVGVSVPKAIDGRPFSDADLSQLAVVGHLLNELDLEDAAVTDASLSVIKQMAGLKILNLRGTQITVDGINEIQEALSGCKIPR